MPIKKPIIPKTKKEIKAHNNPILEARKKEKRLRAKEFLKKNDYQNSRKAIKEKLKNINRSELNLILNKANKTISPKKYLLLRGIDARQLKAKGVSLKEIANVFTLKETASVFGGLKETARVVGLKETASVFGIKEIVREFGGIKETARIFGLKETARVVGIKETARAFSGLKENANMFDGLKEISRMFGIKETARVFGLSSNQVTKLAKELKTHKK